jgi:hypothetical protein
VRSDWEKVELVPPVTLKRGAPRTIILMPGEQIRRPSRHLSAAGNYNKSFKKQRLLDYHAGMRTVDGQQYVYIWRDEQSTP